MADDSVAQDQLRAIIDRLERMHEERKAIAADISEIYAEAKGNGFDVPAIKTVLKLRAMDHSERMEREAIVELYMQALGMAVGPTEREEEIALARAGAHVPVQAHTRGQGAVTTTNSEPQAAPQPVQAQPDFARDATAAIEQEASVAGQEGAAGQHPINQTRPASQAESDLIAPSHGQVAPIQPKPAAQSAEPTEASASDGGAFPAVKGANARLGNAVGVEPSPSNKIQPETPGETAGASASAAPASKYAAPGVVVMEHAPPEPVKWHPYANCFPTVLGDDLKALEVAIHARFGGVEKPIVKIGNQILDGRARYGIARSMLIDYPVVQYAGTDALVDVIAWNLASRNLTSNQIAATAKALAKIEPQRTDEIMAAFGLELAEAAE